RPGAFRTEDIVEAGNSNLNTIVSLVGEVDAFAEQLFPTVFAVRSGRICGFLRALRVVWIQLVVLRIHTGRRRIKDFLNARQSGFFCNVKVDRRRVVHYRSVVFTGENVPGATHVSGKLVDFINSLNNIPDDYRIPKVTNDEFVSRRFCVFVVFQINSSYPESFLLQSLDEMAPDESTTTAYQYFTCHVSSRFLLKPMNSSKL